jgi:hypothetical protein
MADGSRAASAHGFPAGFKAFVYGMENAHYEG